MKIESASVAKSVAGLLSLTAPVGRASDSKSTLRIAVAISTHRRHNWLIFQRELAGDLIRN
jgi:hypothetical protein